MSFPSREKVKELRGRFTKGSKIRCIRMVDEPRMTGADGIIDYVNDAGQVHVNWGGGSSLALNPEIDDYYLY